MNRKLLAGLLGLPLLLSLQPVPAADADPVELKQEAMDIVKAFAGSLKPELVQAIQSGGPAHAISVCAEKAPAIAQRLSQETGWTVKRVSLKPRNSQTAIADTWERRVLQAFDRRQADGESASQMAYSEVVDNRFRFMKAQGVEAVCLSCHAAKIEPEVEAAIEKSYPDDQARGYALGQIRGAFSLARDL